MGGQVTGLNTHPIDLTPGDSKQDDAVVVMMFSRAVRSAADSALGWVAASGARSAGSGSRKAVGGEDSASDPAAAAAVAVTFEELEDCGDAVCSIIFFLEADASSILATSLLPVFRAKSPGVLPSSLTQVGSAPLARSSFTTSAWPFSAAKCSAELPGPYRTFKSAPSLSNAMMLDRCASERGLFLQSFTTSIPLDLGSAIAEDAARLSRASNANRCTDGDHLVSSSMQQSAAHVQQSCPATCTRPTSNYEYCFIAMQYMTMPLVAMAGLVVVAAGSSGDCTVCFEWKILKGSCCYYDAESGSVLFWSRTFFVVDR